MACHGLRRGSGLAGAVFVLEGGLAGDGGLEKSRLRFGFVPLTDCAPLAVARELGFFERRGLDVELAREASWATIRDKVAVEALDGGQMLAAMPLAMTLGLGGLRTNMVVGLSLDLNGNSITLSTALAAEIEAQGGFGTAIQTGAALRKAIAARRDAGAPALRFAVTFPHSSHNYLLRHWLAACAIDPDRDVMLGVVPPPRMLAHLMEGAIDGYCVGAPWGQMAVDLGVGRLALTSHEIWNNHPEKVLGVTRAWAERHPNAHLAAVMALIEACRWLDEPANRASAARLLARAEYVDAPEALIAATLDGKLRNGADDRVLSVPDFHVFHRHAANFPWRGHAVWALTQMRRWGQLGAGIDIAAIADAVYRPEIYRAAAFRLGIPAPSVDFKSEGAHARAYVEDGFALGPDLFCDGQVFDPAAPFRTQFQPQENVR